MKNRKNLWSLIIIVIILIIIFLAVAISSFKRSADEKLLQQSVANIPSQGIITTTSSTSSVIKNTSSVVTTTIMDDKHQKIESNKIKTTGKEEKVQMYIRDEDIYAHVGDNYYKITNKEYLNKIADLKTATSNDEIINTLLKKAKITGEDSIEEVDGETINIRNITIDFSLDNVKLLKYIDEEEFPELYKKVSGILDNINSYNSSVVYKINKDTGSVLGLDSITNTNVKVIGDIVNTQTIDYTKTGESVEFDYPKELDSATPIDSMEDLYAVMMG